jgi:hypothetical protein
VLRLIGTYFQGSIYKKKQKKGYMNISYEFVIITCHLACGNIVIVNIGNIGIVNFDIVFWDYII